MLSIIALPWNCSECSGHGDLQDFAVRWVLRGNGGRLRGMDPMDERLANCPKPRKHEA